MDASRSGIYDWAERQTRLPSPAQQRRAERTEQIVVFHAEFDHAYGSPRITADLRDVGEVVSTRRSRS